MEHRGQSLHTAGKQSRDAGVGAEGMTLKMSISKAELWKMSTEISGIRRLACEQRKNDCVEGPVMRRPRSRKVSGRSPALVNAGVLWLKRPVLPGHPSSSARKAAVLGSPSLISIVCLQELISRVCNPGHRKPRKR